MTNPVPSAPASTGSNSTAPPTGWAVRLREAAVRPVNAASVAVFRIAFGLAMLVNTLLYLPVLVHEYYLATSVHFPYGPFTFVRPLPGMGMYVVYVAMGAAGILIALGLWYRFAAAGFFVLTTYVFLIDSTNFQNHEYLISLLSFLLILVPAHRKWSLDARRRPPTTATVPAWVVWLLRFQIGVPYFFGGIAKLNADWLQGEPLRMWLHRRTDIEVIGPLFNYESVVWLMVYGSLVFDLVVVAFLLHSRTRLPAFVVATSFHLLNARMFGLFIFPWLMIAATTIFFPPDWPERLWARLRRHPAPPPARSRADPDPVGGDQPDENRPSPAGAGRRAPALAAFLVAWMAVQVLLPLRHLAVPEHPNWTEEAHNFAWHMKLREKSGWARFVVTTPDGETFRVNPADYLTGKQTGRLAGHPGRLVRFAHCLSEWHDGAEVRVETSVSLNGRLPVPIVDSTVDLATVSLPWFGHADWILPLEEPLRRD
jgi:vitamin K-dependent gamma-carboxylase